MDLESSDELSNENQADGINSAKNNPPDWVGMGALRGEGGVRGKIVLVAFAVAAVGLGIFGGLFLVAYLFSH